MLKMDLKQLRDKVSNLAKEVADFISEESKEFKLSHVELKGKNDLVTYVDKESEKKIGQWVE